MPDLDLAGTAVLNTRPTQTASELTEAVRTHGGRIVPFPVLEIIPRDAAAVQADAETLAAADVTIFVSRNAAEFGCGFASGRIAAVGPATASALEAKGVVVDILPEGGFDSEHLLKTPELINAEGRSFRIVRGDAGRELLADELSRRGGRVDYLSVYERRLPSYSDAELGEIADLFNNGEVDAIVVMSVNTLQNLDALIPANCADAFHRTPLVTPAARVIKELNKRGPDRPAALAASPRPDDILDAIATATAEPRRT
ncbi:MAG: uroporphyrinogen-III synthase [Woeseiaceae bacterium]|nr:uroporphyrinogen-III synthase [Woeseiaceae bacterium]